MGNCMLFNVSFDMEMCAAKFSSPVDNLRNELGAKPHPGEFVLVVDLFLKK